MILLVLPLPAFADYFDVIQFELKDGCSFKASDLWARFQACETNLSRRGYDVY